jgi:hypothetical protein
VEKTTLWYQVPTLRRRLTEKVRFAEGERNWIWCGYKLLDHVYILSLTVDLSGTPVRDLIEPSS